MDERDEQASFEARAVLPPRRARRARLVLLLPVVALAAIAWAGISAHRPDKATAEVPGPTTIAAPSRTVEARYPAQVVGLAVHRLDAVQPAGLGRNDEIAIAGWYVPTAITDCPAFAALYRPGALPDVRGDADTWAFCDRSGVLYASRPDPDAPVLTDSLEGIGSRSAGLESIAVSVVVGVIVPQALEAIGSAATQVVILGRFVPSGDRCHDPAGCRELVVDHVAWTPGA